MKAFVSMLIILACMVISLSRLVWNESAYAMSPDGIEDLSDTSDWDSL